jgi:hypothetical protein
MAKVPRFAKAFAGRWRIVEMDNWDSDFLDLVEEAHLTFEGKSDGEIAFGALKGFLDVRYGARDGSACAEFSWEGHDENDPACGRGWVIIGTVGRLGGTDREAPVKMRRKARFKCRTTQRTRTEGIPRHPHPLPSLKPRSGLFLCGT